MQLSLNMKTTLSQTLTPQQIQYLKLLQLPLVQLEQHIRQEIEANPLLEEFDTDSFSDANDYAPETNQDYLSEKLPTESKNESISDLQSDPHSMIDDQADPFEFYKMIWQDDSDMPNSNKGNRDDDDFEPFQIKDSYSFIEELKEQISLLNLSEEEMIIADYVLGSINRAGYLVREDIPVSGDGYEYIPHDEYANIPLEEEITARANLEIDERNETLKKSHEDDKLEKESDEIKNPALKYAVSNEAKKIVINNKVDALKYIFDDEDDPKIDLEENAYLKHVNSKDTEKIIQIVQHLDPPGIASRDIRECLLAQLDVLPKRNAAQTLAREILLYAYEAFTMKHYPVILKQFEVSEDYLREALEEIRKLNPKPAGFDFAHEMNAVTPDFIIGKDEESGELLITVNDSRLPSLKVNDAYNKIRQDAKYKKSKQEEAEIKAKNNENLDAELPDGLPKQVNLNREAINWIREKYEDAKFLIQAIRQRKSTMLKVMTAIAFHQRDFFDIGSAGLKPLIYKDISEDTGLDISTICRIVNGKYCQTEFGTFELRYFFSESLTNDDGEEISTRVIKEILKNTVAQEPKSKPLSDEKLSEILKNKGYNVARRTVAKYREQLNIPVARLRKEL